MADEFLLDEMDLPLVNPNEELETVSNNYFKPLFDVSKFEIHSEDFRDKGTHGFAISHAWVVLLVQFMRIFEPQW